MPPTLSAEERRAWRVIGIALAQLPEREQAFMRRPLVEVAIALREGEEVDELFVAGQLGVLALTDRRLVLARRTVWDLLRRRVRIDSIPYDRVAYVDRDPPARSARTVAIGVRGGQSTLVELDSRAAVDRLVGALRPRVTPDPGALDEARLRHKERLKRTERIATIPILAIVSAATAASLAGVGVLSLRQAIWCAAFLWLIQLLRLSWLAAKTKPDEQETPVVRADPPPPDARRWL